LAKTTFSFLSLKSELQNVFSDRIRDRQGVSFAAEKQKLSRQFIFDITKNFTH
jgi:hypothetical protein